MPRFLSIIAALTVFSSVAQAHFLLNFPATRGFDEDTENTFCNGFATNATGRHDFPLSGSTPVTITSAHDKWQFAIILSSSPNPTGFADFNSSGSTSFLLNFGSGSGQGDFCFNVDMASLATKLNLVNGSLVTLQAEFNGGDGALFQCSDLVLVQGSTSASGVKCSNATGNGAATLPSGSSSGSAAAPSSTVKNSGAMKEQVGALMGLVGAGIALLL